MLVARRARTRADADPRDRDRGRIGLPIGIRAGGGSSRRVRGRGRARFDSRRGFAPAALGRGKAGVRARGGDVTKARTTISSYRNIDASAAGSGEPRVRRAYHDDDLVAREVGSRSRV